MQASFEPALGHVLRVEGGFVDHPLDPGGATNLGITHATLARWRGRPVAPADVRALTRAEAAAIYRARFWKAVAADRLPAGVDLLVFDIAVASGPGRAARMLQQELGVAADGIVGPLTLAAAARARPGTLIAGLTARRLSFLGRLSTFAVFGRGWRRRARDAERAALSLAGSTQETLMDQTKTLLASRTLWSNVIGLAAVGLSLAGFDTKLLDPGALADAALQVVAAGGFIASTVFRIVATKRLTA